VGYGPLRSEEELAFKTRAEFGRQIYNLLAKGYPRVAGLTSTEFLAHVYPLLGHVTELQSSEGAESEAIPFVIVVKSDLAPRAETIGLVERRDESAFSVLDADDLDGFDRRRDPAGWPGIPDRRRRHRCRHPERDARRRLGAHHRATALAPHSR
jgi:Family of unknown function (DUF5701)